MRLADRVLLWFAFLGPAAAWTAHLLIGYGYEDAACSNDAGVDLVEPLILVATVALGAVTVAAGVAGLRLRRRERDDPRGRVAFMAVFGLLSSPVFLFAIVLGGINALALDPCAPG